MDRGEPGGQTDMYAIYSFLLTLVALLTSPYWLMRGLRQRKYLNTVAQRISWDLPAGSFSGRPLWIHAVSVGEVLAAKVLVAELRTARPDIPIVISTVKRTPAPAGGGAGVVEGGQATDELERITDFIYTRTS